MPNTLVYLAGPILGENRDALRSIHQAIGQYLRNFDVTCLSPLRPHDTLALPIERDLLDIRRCDLVFANFLSQKQDPSWVSVGTCVELGYARALGKPIVVAYPQGSRYDHLFITHGAALATSNMEDALAGIVQLLSTGA